MSALPTALFGGMLWGDRAVRFVHVDEAGTSEHEPVTIVVGLIIDADKQLLRAEAAIEELLLSVPEEFREGFVFHAMAIWGSPKYRDRWAFTDRLGLLRRMMALPRRLGIPVSMSFVRRSSGPPPPRLVKKGVTPSQFHHFQAFANCMAIADKYIRDHADLSEVGTVVAENVPQMRQFLRAALNMWRDDPVVLPPGGLVPTEEERKLGYIKQEGEYRVSRLRKNIHFVEKGDDPLTQMADACAFGFRRFFAKEDFGQEFCDAILGRRLLLSDYDECPSAVDTFRGHP